MGSLRRGLILAILPTPALAQSCDPAVTALGQALATAASGPSLFLIAATALAVVLRNQWGGLVACVLWSFWLMFGAIPEASAIASGCAGHPWIYLTGAIALCIGVVLWTIPREAD